MGVAVHSFDWSFPRHYQAREPLLVKGLADRHGDWELMSRGPWFALQTMGLIREYVSARRRYRVP